MSLSLSDFNYALPAELIAQQPARPRDSSRLLLLNKKTGEIKHQAFSQLPGFLKPGDLLVINDSRVFPARLLGRKKGSGGAIEVFLHRRLARRGARENWECLIRGRVHPGTVLEFETGRSGQPLRAEVMAPGGDGVWQVGFEAGKEDFFRIIKKIGFWPLPPYIKRQTSLKSDVSRYQTVFSDKRRFGSVAAPTAGLHFTRRLLKSLQECGVKIVRITLHVGLGTFSPVKEEDLSRHRMHSERLRISAASLKEILLAKRSGRRIIAVGTTSCRALESLDLLSLERSKRIRAQNFSTDIFILPGYKFKLVDALITNFHLPRSTLLMLVSALAGREQIGEAYQEAIARRYRFFSYGDAMFIH